MDNQTSLPHVKEQIEKANSLVIVTHPNPSMDSVGSALSLYLGLLGLGKTVSVVCPDPITVEFSNFVAANKLETKLRGKRNFVISLDYQEGSIEKVSYNIEGNKFNLVIEPRPGFEDFSEEKVHYTRSGGSADCIIVVDTPRLEDLGSVYEENRELFREKPVINVDHHEGNALFGAINLIDARVSSMTELMAVLMSFIGVKLTEDIATNLLNALIEATDHFQSSKVNARTFEVASVCMKAGAKRFPITKNEPQFRAAEPVQPKMEQPVSPAPQHAPQPAPHQPAAQQSKSAASQDDEWLKPKIFKNPNANV